MKNIFKLIFFVILTVFISSCGNSDDDVNFDINQRELGQGEEADDCLGFEENELLLSIQDQFTTLPGKVSILFKVFDSAGTPISGLTADQFTIYEQGRNDDCFNTISSSESSARISSNSQIFNNTTLLVLDLSNSVLESSLDELKTASTSFITNVIPTPEADSFKMAIYWFDGEDELHLLNPPTSSATELTAAIDGITTDISTDPSTDLYGAVIKSTQIAEDEIKANNEASVIGAASIVLFTDGTDQASRFSEETALRAVNDANQNISFFTIGLGSEIDTSILTNIGKTASVFAGNKEELEATFTQISQRVSEQANSFYLFEYCTPKRDGSGDNNLVIQLTNGGLQGAVQTKFSANGFMGGCE
ncbi:VWA domain-containing protein [Flagellimonas sp. HMM57]|uniref:vWA domain-containing protein n=1 Tax=unclassified Flagellimonas TaxID=2644544 RepID=UPI0013D3D30C|nr:MULTISPECIES: VWA domain-containing protein [unclassified Flagellimonas]UII75872.1 VWA domain-containing protein [Flagellimonas sp. HMM57]